MTTCLLVLYLALYPPLRVAPVGEPACGRTATGDYPLFALPQPAQRRKT